MAFINTKLLLFFLIFIFSCEDKNKTSLVEKYQEGALVGFMADGIIDFQTDAFEVDKMYTHYDTLGNTLTATYDTVVTSLSDLYKSVTPCNYTWSVRGVTYDVNLLNFKIEYDTTDVYGTFILHNLDLCNFNIGIDDSLKIGTTYSICSTE